MDKAQSIQAFWESFDLPAYDETSVPDDAELPYITYEVRTDSIGNPLSMSGSIWYRSMSWEAISKKTEEIAEAIVRRYPLADKIDGGRVYISKGTPFAQRMADPSDRMIRRMLLNITVEFFTEV